MTSETFKALDPDLLLEASRVMNAAGPEYANATRLISNWALRNLAKAAPQTRAAILGDAAALRLRTPGHYDEALEKLQEIDSLECPDPDGRLHMLRALANGQKYTVLRKKNKELKPEETKTPETIFTQLRESICEDLTIAFKREKTTKHDNAVYWKVADPKLSFPERDQQIEDDLRQVYLDDPVFQALVDASDEDLPGRSSTTGGGTSPDAPNKTPPGGSSTTGGETSGEDAT